MTTSPDKAVGLIERSTRDNLIAARALIDTPEKWGKGNGHFLFARVPEHLHCAVTACAQAAMDAGREDGDYGAMYEALKQQLPPKFEAVWSFNDHPRTTHADIMALFDRAIEASQ